MLRATELAGYVGVALAASAYVPQIWHLTREHCSAGISPLAFGVWLLSSLLVTLHALAIGSGVFIVLGAVQIVAIAAIMVCAKRYADSDCASHVTLDAMPPGSARASAGSLDANRATGKAARDSRTRDVRSGRRGAGRGRAVRLARTPHRTPGRPRPDC